MNWSFFAYSYSEGQVEEKEDGYYLGDRKLEIYDHFEIITNE
jgi:hypothetical protein